MVFSILIGHDVARTFLNVDGITKNLFQALLDGDLGPVDENKLTVSLDNGSRTATLSLIPIQNIEWAGLKLILGGHIGQDEMTPSGPIQYSLTSWVPWDGYEKVHRETVETFKKIGIEDEPIVHAYFPLEEVQPFEDNDWDLRSPETVKRLRQNIDLILKHRRDPFVPMPYKERDDLHLLTDEEVERIRKSEKYRFVMEEMGANAE